MPGGRGVLHQFPTGSAEAAVVAQQPPGLRRAHPQTSLCSYSPYLALPEKPQTPSRDRKRCRLDLTQLSSGCSLTTRTRWQSRAHWLVAAWEKNTSTSAACLQPKTLLGTALATSQEHELQRSRTYERASCSAERRSAVARYHCLAGPPRRSRGTQRPLPQLAIRTA